MVKYMRKVAGHFVSIFMHVYPAVYVVNWVSMRWESCTEVKL